MRALALFRHLRDTMAVLAALLVVAGLIMIAAIAPAMAAGVHHPAGAGLERGTNVWYGHIKGAGGERWYCGDPSAGGRYLAEPFHQPGSTYSEMAHTTTWTPASDGGRPMPPDAVRALAYLLATHAATDDNHAAASAAWAIRTLSVSGGGTGNPTPAGGDLAASGQAMIDDSYARRGPYVVVPDLAVDPAGTTATVTNYTARSEATGAPVGGAATLIIEGPAVFAETGQATATGDGSPLTLVSTGSGAVRVVSTVTGLPSDQLTYRVPHTPGYQRMLVAGQQMDVSGAATADLTGFPDAAVTITTTILREGETPQLPARPDDANATFAANTLPGDRVVDAMWLDGALWREDLTTGFVGTVTAELVRLPAEGATDGSVVDTVTIDVDTSDDAHWETTADGHRQTRRDAPYVTPAVTIPADARPGERFSWRISTPEWSDPSHFGTARQPAMTVEAGVVTETTTIDRGRPRFSTTVSASQIALGESVTDSITVDGMWSGADQHGAPASVDVVWAVYGPYREHPALTDRCDASFLAGSGVMTVDADGVYETPPFTPTAPGYYTYVVESAQTRENHAATTPCGEPAETTRVVAPEEAVLPDVGAAGDLDWMAVMGFGLMGSGGAALGHVFMRRPAAPTPRHSVR